MQVLVIGGGGREHALAWKLAASPRVERVYVAPGNAGTALEPGIENLDIAVDDFAALLDFAQRAPVDLTVVGPEAPLAAGVVGALARCLIRCHHWLRKNHPRRCEWHQAMAFRFWGGFLTPLAWRTNAPPWCRSTLQ